MQPGTEVTWDDLKVGTPYMVTFRDPTEGAISGRLQRKTSTSGAINYSSFDRDEVDHIYVPKTKTTEFAKKLALLNTKMGADPGVLSEIMKFQKPDFKPGPWTKMTKAQAAVSAAKAGTRRRRKRRSTRRRR